MTDRSRRNETGLLACLLALFVCRAILASVVVPPWQGPDEPTHFLLAGLLADRDVDTANLIVLPEGIFTTIERDLQRDVLRSMVRHRWWEPYGGSSTSGAIPTSFRQIGRIGVGTFAQPFYYESGAAVLRAFQPRDVETDYWRLRAFGVVLSVATLAFGWAGTRILFGTEVAAGATAIAALHPQFLLTAISVNPDVLLNVCGAFMWWQAARIVKGYRRDLSLTLLLIGLAVALLTKRSAMPLVIVAAILTMWMILAPRVWRIILRNMLFAGAAIALVTVALFAWVAWGGPGSELVTFWRTAPSIRRALEPTTWRQVFEYARLSIDYVWLIAGWLRFPAPDAWLWVVRCLTIAGLGGAAFLLVRSPGRRQSLLVAWLFVIVPAITVIGWGFVTLSSPQGRYLFPVIMPATALLWLGLTENTPERFRRYAAPALLSILAVMDVTGFSNVLTPAYLPWG